MSTSSCSESSLLPQWFDIEYIQKVLRDYYKNESIKVVKLDSCPASAQGENFVCTMSRIFVKYISDKCKDIKMKRFILKEPLDSDNEVKAIFDSYGVYDHELEMYGKVFPTIGAILTKPEYYQDLVPRTIAINYDHQCILLEDLTKLGYIMPDFKKGLDRRHVEMILVKLAKIHAASVIADTECPGRYKSYDRGILNKHSRKLDGFFSMNFEVCARKTASFKGYEIYGEKMLTLLPHFIEYVIRSVEAKPHHMNVLIHGDLWSNNTMFRYNKENEPMDVMFLDFQFSCWTSPTVDLHYFLNTSLVDELRENHIEEFVHFYYLHFVDALKDLSFSGRVLTLHQFWVEYLETSFYALFTITISQPLMMNDEIADASLEYLINDSERSKRGRNAIYNNVRTQKNLQALIPVCDRRGLLDVEQ